VWPPYSILVWMDFAQRDQLEVTFAFKRYVYEALKPYANAKIIDLQAEESVTHDLDRYTDLYHFAPDVNDWLVRQACARSGADAATLAAAEQHLRAQIARLQPPGALEAFAAGSN